MFFYRNNGETGHFKYLSNEEELNFNVKYYLDPKIFHKYALEYNILNQGKNAFFKKRLFNLKQCLSGNNNMITFTDDFSIKDRHLNGNVHLHYNSELQQFDYILLENTQFNLNYFYLAYKDVFLEVYQN